MKKTALLVLSIFFVCISACVSQKHYHVYQENNSGENPGYFATDMLQHEFESAERVLQIMEKAANCLNKGDFITQETFRSIIEINREFLDKSHQEKEDKILFPFLKSLRGSEKKDFLGRLLMDHVTARDKIRDMLMSTSSISQGKKAKKKFTKIVYAYIKHMKKHMHMEEEILFPWINKVLTHEEQLTLMNNFKEKEKDFVQADTQGKYTAMIEELERQLGLCPE